MKLWIEFIATLFYSGHLKPASGTWGSFLAWLIYVFLTLIVDIHFWIIFSVIFLSFLIGILVSSEYEKSIQKHDPSEVVIDEFVGQWIALFIIPQNMLAFILAFFLFRFFDIIKLWPANISQKLPGGWGIMVDDIIAGFYAAGLIILVL